MTGCRKGKAKLMKDEEPLDIYMHCFSHSLNSAGYDAVRGSDIMEKFT